MGMHVHHTQLTLVHESRISCNIGSRIERLMLGGHHAAHACHSHTGHARHARHSCHTGHTHSVSVELVHGGICLLHDLSLALLRRCVRGLSLLQISVVTIPAG